MQESNVLPRVNCGFDNDLHKLEKILTIYSVCRDKSIRGFEKLVLKYYLKYGFSTETKKIISEDTGKRPEYINTINTHLRDKGFLVEDKYKQTYLHHDMEQLREFFVNDNKRIYIISLDG